MRYINITDIETKIQADYLALYFPTENEFDTFYNLATDEVRGYLLAANIDVEKLFTLPNPYEQGTFYPQNTLVFWENEFWKAKKDVILQVPKPNEFWEKTYVKSAKIVSILCDIMIYHASLKISTEMIPLARENAYKDSIEYLKGIAAGRISIALPKIASENQTHPNIPFFGGQPIKNRTY